MKTDNKLKGRDLINIGIYAAAAVLMSFSSFGYYGQIWFNRAYTYECAVEEMPAGYGDTLMSVSPVWVFPVVVIAGIVLSVLIANVSGRRIKPIESQE